MSLLSPFCEVFNQRSQPSGIFLGTPECDVARTAQKITGTTSGVLVVGMKSAMRHVSAGYSKTNRKSRRTRRASKRS